MSIYADNVSVVWLTRKAKVQYMLTFPLFLLLLLLLLLQVHFVYRLSSYYFHFKTKWQKRLLQTVVSTTRKRPLPTQNNTKRRNIHALMHRRKCKNTIQVSFDRSSTDSRRPGPCLRHRLIYGYETVFYRVGKELAAECAGRSWNVTPGGTTG